ncbi:DNA repair protein RecN [Sinanaerobacter chloroacetimidivorans]|uniref:DNA repair protein RecN n=1 Tax=Sinanaerobacter chloroacetimidivorans TaxID=2818044 RepID=A0A8J8AZN9_9FIRM|nr:DNA repair protein RecN [Sinanaerobacter chloroacetimidivorans]MBR0596379.1 DNA repair protein RecN [Sinanaerobacter chloroacetimidivorans]
MISHLSIKDFAIIEKVDVAFYEGLNMITGETGAGKSIIIEAISLALGSRADTAYIRTGKEKAVIQMVADLEGEEYVITREISANGKSLCRINDEIVPLSQLNKLCRKIADIHGQYDHQSLLNQENHIKLIDSYDDKVISPVKLKVSELFHLYTQAKQELNSLLSNEAEMERKRDFMRFELQEISASRPVIGEDEELTQKFTLLQNSEKIYQTLSGLYEILYESSPSSLDGIGKGLSLLQQISCYSNEIKEFEDVMSDSYYKLTDVATEVRKYRDHISFSPEILEETQNRLQVLDTLKRKYGGSIENVLEYEKKLADELNVIENMDQLKESLTEQLLRYEKQLLEESEKLSKLRKNAAILLEEKINKELMELNFKNAAITIQFDNVKDGKASVFTAEGIDKVEFLISTNLGEASKPLAKIASGGEISRIMLAFKQIIGDYDYIPTMIFDEIDSGISGITASIVGKKLLEISKSHQIICISHLPQIAAFGDHHYKIQKEVVGDATVTNVIPLSQEEKIQEIARLLGGINITDTTIKSAEELIRLSNS